MPLADGIISGSVNRGISSSPSTRRSLQRSAQRVGAPGPSGNVPPITSKAPPTSRENQIRVRLPDFTITTSSRIFRVRDQNLAQGQPIAADAARIHDVVDHVIVVVAKIILHAHRAE